MSRLMASLGVLEVRGRLRSCIFHEPYPRQSTALPVNPDATGLLERGERPVPGLRQDPDLAEQLVADRGCNSLRK